MATSTKDLYAKLNAAGVITPEDRQLLQQASVRKLLPDDLDVAVRETEIKDYEAAGGGTLSSIKRGFLRQADSALVIARTFWDQARELNGLPFTLWDIGHVMLGGKPEDMPSVKHPAAVNGALRAAQEAIGRAQSDLPVRPEMIRAVEAANRAPGLYEGTKAFAREIAASPNTGGALIDQFAELTPQFLTMMLGGAAVGGAKVVGAAGPYAQQPLIQLAGTAGKLAPKINTSINLGFAGGMSSVLNTLGPNYREAIEKGLSEDQARARAGLQSVAQGGVDALTTAVIPWKIGPNQYTNMPAQTLIQAAGGGFGEALRNYVVGEEPETGELVPEIMLELLGMPGDIAAAAWEAGKQGMQYRVRGSGPAGAGGPGPGAPGWTPGSGPQSGETEQPRRVVGDPVAHIKRRPNESAIEFTMRRARAIRDHGGFVGEAQRKHGLSRFVDNEPGAGLEPVVPPEQFPALVRDIQAEKGKDFPFGPVSPTGPVSAYPAPAALPSPDTVSAPAGTPAIAFEPGTAEAQLAIVQDLDRDIQRRQKDELGLTPDVEALVIRRQAAADDLERSLIQAREAKGLAAIRARETEKAWKQHDRLNRPPKVTKKQVARDERLTRQQAPEDLDERTRTNINRLRANRAGSQVIDAAVIAEEERLAAEAQADEQALENQGELRQQPFADLRELMARKETSELDEAAHEAATSPLNARPEPTDAQKQADRYKLGPYRHGGLDLAFENPEGSIRSGKDADGNAWEQELHDHYGKIRRTKGADGEGIDVFAKPGVDDLSAHPVFVVNQSKKGSDTFDEHKTMAGYDSEAEAREAYLRNYKQGWDGLKSIGQTTWDGFRAWLETGDTKAEFPVAAAPQELGAAAQEQETDLAGPVDRQAQALSDERIRKDERRDGLGRETVPVEAGDGDLFSGRSRQVDVEDVAGKAKAEPKKPLSEIWRIETVEVEDTGETVSLKESAEALGGRLSKRISTMEKLLECLGS